MALFIPFSWKDQECSQVWGRGVLYAHLHVQLEAQGEKIQACGGILPHHPRLAFLDADTTPGNDLSSQVLRNCHQVGAKF